jgi:hypothetical protein
MFEDEMREFFDLVKDFLRFVLCLWLGIFLTFVTLFPLWLILYLLGVR